MAQRLRTLTFTALTVTALLAVGCGAGSGSGRVPQTTAEGTTRTTAPTPPPSAFASAGRATPSWAPSAGTRSASPPSPTPTRPAAAPWCTTDRLKASVRTLEPAAGQHYAALVLTNGSGTTCRTRGWIGMQLIGANGQKVPTQVVRDDSEPASVIRLMPGGSSWARLHWTTVPTGAEPDTGACRPTADKVLVTPPDQDNPLTAAWRLGPVCASGRIDTLPLAPGTGPS